MSNNKPHIIIRVKEKGTCMLIDIAISGDRNVIRKEAKIFKTKDLTTETQHVWEYENKSDTSNTRENWNYIEIIQKLPKQHTVKARHQATTENSHIGHCTHTWESTNVRAQNIQHGK